MKKEKVGKVINIIATISVILGVLIFFVGIFSALLTDSFEITPILCVVGFSIILLGCVIPSVIASSFGIKVKILDQNENKKEKETKEVVEEVKNKTEKQISKKCQYCGKKYKGETDICPHCGAGQE